ncbi:MAG: hypothetical protein LBC64_02295 [Fibromonadaceae bacterium]|jgi:hypothetical protein|nr:hypothetical protein [Fibromonadaceae bacterium]
MIFKFFKASFSALIGRRQWFKIKKKYDIENGKYVLLMPENDRELNETALKHVDDLLKYRKGKSVLILSTDNWVLENAKNFSNNILDVVKITEKQMDNYCYYYYYYFSERFLIVSFTKPYGNVLFKADGINRVTKEDLICLGIFLIRSWESKEECHG